MTAFVLLILTILGGTWGPLEGAWTVEVASVATPVAQPVSTALPDAFLLSREELRPALERTWPEYRHEEVLAVIDCESRFKPGAVGDNGRAFGLMQIRIDFWPHLAAAYDLTDPEQNLAAGRQAFLEWRAAFGGSGVPGRASLERRDL